MIADSTHPGLLPGEVIRPIPGLNGRYSVTSLGRVFSHVYRHRQYTQELAQATHPEGYKRVKLSELNPNTPTPVHRLVAAAFHANPAGLPQVNHIDGNKGNNRAENLEWVDNAGNQQHAFRAGLQRREKGEQHHMAKLTEQQVRDIKAELARVPKFKGQQTGLAARYGVTNYCIHDIAKGKAWGHINAA